MASALLFGLIGIVILFALIYLFVPSLFEVKNNTVTTVEVGDARPGEGRARRHWQYSKGLVDTYRQCTTISQLFRESAEKFRGSHCLGSRQTVKVEKEAREVIVDGKPTKKMFDKPYMKDYEWKTFDEVDNLITRFGAGLERIGVTPGSNVSIYANSREEWQISAQACFARSFPIVSSYASLGEKALAYTLAQTDSKYLITEAALIANAVDACLESNCTTVIYMDQLTPDQLETCRKKCGTQIRLFMWDQVVEWGIDKRAPTRPPQPEDLAVIMYTSGSSGNPKGVMMTHRNIVSVVAGALAMIPLTSNDVYIAFLPLAHVLELVVENAIMAVGGAVGYASPRRLKDTDACDERGQPRGDLSALRPTLMASVPLVLDRLRGAIEEKVNNGSAVVRALFRLAFWAKRRDFYAGREHSPLWDMLVFKKVARNFGGRLRIVLSGGAPLSQHTQEFCNIAFCAKVIQGYGLTETAGGGTITSPQDTEFERVGIVKPCCEMKLVDVPEMNYRSSDAVPRGEICVRGGNVSSGYYKLPDKTASDFRADEDKQGHWFYTGDIGQWNTDGTLSIIDRKKDLVKLAHGEYIALGHLESVYRGSPLIEEICVYANSKHTFAVAIVVANRKKCLELLAANGTVTDVNLPDHEWKQLCTSKTLTLPIEKSLLEVAKKAKFEKVECVNGVVVEPDPWTPDSGLVTESFKLRRQQITEHYDSQIKALYASKGE